MKDIILKKLFQSNNHKDVMLRGLYVSFLLIFISIALSALMLGYTTAFWINLGIAAILALFLYTYITFHKLQLHAALFMLILELESTYVLMGEHFNSYILVYPFFIIFGFFFFFKLRHALWLTLLHLSYWVMVILYGSSIFPDYPIFHTVSLVNMTINSAVAVALALFCHISTKNTYQKLQHANRQKELLLQEIHHRIKNNLNKISSMIGLQILSIEEGNVEKVEEVLKKGKLRIEAMAMIHDTLYRSHNLEKINFETYIKHLTQLINDSYDTPVPVEIYAEHIFLPLEVMMKLGIIINELMINTIKHAKPNKRNYYMIFISLNKHDHEYTFTYHQHGDNFIDLDALKHSKNLGMKLIQLSVKEMDGTLNISGEQGLSFTISFSLERATDIKFF